MPRLSGKCCLVTGAAGGIGAAIARTFVREGADVVVTDIDTEQGLALATTIGARFMALDVTDEPAWHAIAQAVPRLDVMVNNAGITGLESGTEPHDPETVSLEAWRRVQAVNLDGTCLGCQYAIQRMRPAGTGAIINIASRSAMIGVPGAAAYAASKAGVISLTKSMALYCAEQDLAIRCNAIVPGAVLTPLWEPMLGQGPEREERERIAVADTPMKRFGTSDEVAATALFLASDEAAYITGAVIPVDGGLCAGG